MATRGGTAECHILQITYEILKEILLLLPQKDLLLRVLPTCTRLWQVAYPMTYRQIVVMVGPARSNSAWKQLVSGNHNGVPFIQKLEIRSFYEDNETPVHEEDVVMGSIVAALFKDQLLSFRLTTPNAIRRTVSIRNVNVLHETQQSLNDLEFPGIHDPGNISPQNHLADNVTWKNVSSLATTVRKDYYNIQLIKQIALNSTRLQEFHLRTSGLADHAPSWSVEDGQPILKVVRSALPFVTKMTLFSINCYGVWNSVSFPQTQCLSFIKCRSVDTSLSSPDGPNLPSLKALMVKQISLDRFKLSEVLNKLKSLRELILDIDMNLADDDVSSITQHGEWLELLAVPQLHYFQDLNILSMLEECHALRHLSIGGYDTHFSSNGKLELRSDAFEQFINFLAKSGQIRTLGVRFSHFVWPSGTGEYFSVDSLRKILRSNFIGEIAIGRILDILKNSRDVDVDTEPFHYVCVSSHLIFREHTFDSENYSILEGSVSPEKRVLALKEEVVFKQIQEVKRDITAQFSASQYHLLEDYINCLVAENSAEVL